MRNVFRVSLLLSAFFLIPSHLFALDIPKRAEGYVNDHAGLLSPKIKDQLEQALKVYETHTSNQIVVVTFPSLEGESLEDFSIHLAEVWKIGQLGRDNGVIFLIFKEDRKMRIEVGYGLEGTLPDALAGQIINQIVAPLFKQEEYERGVLAGVQAIVRATQGEYKVPRQPRQMGYRRPLTPEDIQAMKAQGKVAGVIILILVALFFVFDYFRYRGYLREHGVYKSRYSFWEWWFRFAILLFVLSMLFRILFYAMLFSRGGYYGGRGGFGGFSGGGGGGFGGGGASGGW